jgi:Kef-type K+ transport system membrane component KefB
MEGEPIIFTIFLIFTGAALLATAALYARQSLLVVYIVLGIIMGPSGIMLVTDPVLIKHISHIGIIFLLFLLGLNLPPDKLIHLMRETTVITAISSLLFGVIGFGVGIIFGYTTFESIIIAVSLIFSSTIIGIKLLPTTVLHHRRIGEIIISILLLQDLIAIVVLVFIQAANQQHLVAKEIAMLVLAFAGLILFAYLFNRFALLRLIQRFDRIREYVFLITLGWCMGMAQLASSTGLSYEIGAFIAGVALATSPVALFIAELLKPLRDFFLILFFFSLGATFDITMIKVVLIPALMLALLVLTLKPLIYRILLRHSGESTENAIEIGVRLGQGSEFSLLIAVLASDMELIGTQSAYLIQVCTLVTFIVSSYLTVRKYPTPVAVSDALRRD